MNFPKLTKGVFYTLDENNNFTDKGIVDEMLVNEEEIRQDLIKAGVIQEFTGRMMTPEEIAAN